MVYELILCILVSRKVDLEVPPITFNLDPARNDAQLSFAGRQVRFCSLAGRYTQKLLGKSARNASTLGRTKSIS